MLKPLEEGVARVEYKKVEDEIQLKTIASELTEGTVSQLIFAGHGSQQALDLGPNLMLEARHIDGGALRGAWRARDPWELQATKYRGS